MANDDTILHEDDVKDVIDAEVGVLDDAYATKHTGTTIASPTAPGSSYVQAEMASLKTAIDSIRAALTASGVTG